MMASFLWLLANLHTCFSLFKGYQYAASFTDEMKRRQSQAKYEQMLKVKLDEKTGQAMGKHQVCVLLQSHDW